MTLPLSYSRENSDQWSVTVISFSCRFKPQSSGHRKLNCQLSTAAELLELMTRIELVTSPLPRECSTN